MRTGGLYRRGLVKFVGQLDNKEEIVLGASTHPPTLRSALSRLTKTATACLGVELSRPCQECHDGYHAGELIFKCAPSCGIFVPSSMAYHVYSEQKSILEFEDADCMGENVRNQELDEPHPKLTREPTLAQARFHAPHTTHANESGPLVTGAPPQIAVTGKLQPKEATGTSCSFRSRSGPWRMLCHAVL